MELVLLVIIVLLLGVIALISPHTRRDESRYYQVIGQKVPGSIPTIAVSDFHAALANDPFKPTFGSEVCSVGQAGSAVERQANV
jgi:hypothetical protein